MAITDVKNPEQDLQVETRAKKQPAKPVEIDDTERLRLLMQKIRAGMNSDAVVDPRKDNPLPCRDCYQRGWHAALKKLLED